MAPSTPSQYFGDDRDKGLGRAVSEGRRREFEAFGWKPEDVPDPQAKATFERSKLRWEECKGPVLEWCRALIRLRRTLEGEARVRFDEEARWIVVERGCVQLACNLAEEPQRVPADGEMLLASEDGVRAGEPLPPESCAFLAAPTRSPSRRSSCRAASRSGRPGRGRSSSVVERVPRAGGGDHGSPRRRATQRSAQEPAGSSFNAG